MNSKKGLCSLMLELCNLRAVLVTSPNISFLLLPSQPAAYICVDSPSQGAASKCKSLHACIAYAGPCPKETHIVIFHIQFCRLSKPASYLEDRLTSGVQI